MMLSIKRIFSPINLPLINPVWSLLMSFGRVAWILFAVDFAIILQSQFKRDKGRQFLRFLRSVSFLGMSFINPRL